MDTGCRPLRRAAPLLATALVLGGTARANQQIEQVPLAGADIPKYQDALPVFTAGQRVEARTQATSAYTVKMQEFQQQVLPAAYPATWVWGYQVDGKPAHYPGFTVEAERGVPVTATYVNEIGTKQPDGTFGPPLLQKYLTLDQTLQWADPLRLLCPFTPPAEAVRLGCHAPYGYPDWPGRPLSDPRPPGAPVPVVAHLHGGEDPSSVDGGPEQWFTPEGWRQLDAGGGLGPPHPALNGPSYFSEASVAGGAVYTYPNGQEAANLWFHDHAFGTTRLNVYGGLAAFYLLRDRNDTGRSENPLRLPADPFEIEMAFQDRRFDTKGQLLYPDEGVNPSLCGPSPAVECHPFWQPEFFGDAIVVNGKTWPFLEVEPRRYRFRWLDGSDARFYNLAIAAAGRDGPDIWVIGTDGGLLDRPVRVSASARLLMAPGERYDVIVDFSRFYGETLTLTNDAPAPFPDGDAADPDTTGQLMQFRVVKSLSSVDDTCDPAARIRSDGRERDDDGEDGDEAGPGHGDGRGRNACRLRGGRDREPRLVRLARAGDLAGGVRPALRRQLVLNEVLGPEAPVEVLLNNTSFSGLKESTLITTPRRIPESAPSSYETGIHDGDADHRWLTELPRVGSTELWELINITGDAHPIHLHLVQFQIVNRQAIADEYAAAWEAAFPGGTVVPGEGPPYHYLNDGNPTIPPGSRIVGGNPLVDPHLSGSASPPAPQESGWKDTIVVPPGMVTRLAVRFAPQDVPAHRVRPGENRYPFDPTQGPGYVWHCHILEHEDNEMMRPYAVVW